MSTPEERQARTECDLCFGKLNTSGKCMNCDLPKSSQVLTFRQWHAHADLAICRALGVNINAFTDKPWRRWYDSGLEPKAAAKRAVQEEAGQLFIDLDVEEVFSRC